MDIFWNYTINHEASLQGVASRCPRTDRLELQKFTTTTWTEDDVVTVDSAMNGTVNIHAGFNSQIVLSFLGTVLYRISKWPTHLRVASFDHACSFGDQLF